MFIPRMCATSIRQALALVYIQVNELLDDPVQHRSTFSVPIYRIPRRSGERLRNVPDHAVSRPAYHGYGDGQAIDKCFRKYCGMVRLDTNDRLSLDGVPRSNPFRALHAI